MIPSAVRQVHRADRFEPPIGDDLQRQIVTRLHPSGALMHEIFDLALEPLALHLVQTMILAEHMSIVARQPHFFAQLATHAKRFVRELIVIDLHARQLLLQFAQIAFEVHDLSLFCMHDRHIYCIIIFTKPFFG